jgi:hypothetical protein
MALRSIVLHDKCKEHQRIVTDMTIPMFKPLSFTNVDGRTAAVEFNNGTGSSLPIFLATC